MAVWAVEPKIQLCFGFDAVHARWHPIQPKTGPNGTPKDKRRALRGARRVKTSPKWPKYAALTCPRVRDHFWAKPFLGPKLATLAVPRPLSAPQYGVHHMHLGCVEGWEPCGGQVKKADIRYRPKGKRGESTHSGEKDPRMELRVTCKDADLALPYPACKEHKRAGSHEGKTRESGRGGG